MTTTGRKKTQEKQDQILRAAAEIFAVKDFDLVLMEEVAARAGVGKGTLYRYFPTKEDLYFATVFSGIDQLRAEIEDLTIDGRSLKETLEAVAVVIFRLFWSRRPLQSLIYQYEVRLRGSQGAEWLERRGVIADLVARIFARAAAAGEIAEVDPRLAAELFLGMVRSANLYRTDLHSPESLGQKLSAILVDGLRNHDQRPARS